MSDFALTAALATVDELAGAADDPGRQLVAAKCRGLMVGYHARWAGAEWSPVVDDADQPILEQTIHLPIVNPETGARSRTWTQAGKFDGIVSGYGRILLLEHKTTSDEIADPNGVYWRRLRIDAQVSGYMLQSWQGGLRLDGSLYDVIRKPAIRPRRLTAKDVAEILDRGTYCGFGVTAEALDAVRSGIDNEERILELYSIRVAVDALAEPGKYYQRQQISRTDADVAEYATELWAIGQEILADRNRGVHFRNSSACLDYNRPCEYLGLCSGYDSPESDRWQRAEAVHAELALDVEDGGRSVLTHSRIKTYQTCRRKHHLRYELGLRRADSEGEALVLGTILHEALRAWWSNLGATPNQGDGNAIANVCPATAVGQSAIAAP